MSAGTFSAVIFFTVFFVVIVYLILPLYFLFSKHAGERFWKFQKYVSIVLVALFFLGLVVFPIYWGVKSSIEKSSWLPIIGATLWVVIMFTGGARYKIKYRR